MLKHFHLCTLFPPIFSCTLNSFLVTLHFATSPSLWQTAQLELEGIITCDTWYQVELYKCGGQHICSVLSRGFLCQTIDSSVQTKSQRTSHENYLRQKCLVSMSCNMSQRFLWLLKEMWTCAFNIHRSWSVCVYVLYLVVMYSALWPVGEERKEKTCEGKLDIWTCQDLSLRSLRCIVHMPSEAFEACHLSATAGLPSSTNKTHTGTYPQLE